MVLVKRNPFDALTRILLLLMTSLTRDNTVSGETTMIGRKAVMRKKCIRGGGRSDGGGLRNADERSVDAYVGDIGVILCCVS